MEEKYMHTLKGSQEFDRQVLYCVFVCRTPAAVSIRGNIQHYKAGLFLSDDKHCNSFINGP